MEGKIYDCIVVGGGISGISFAYYLTQRGKNVLVLEKESKIGGQAQSPHSVINENYWRELGAHTCYNSYTHLLSIVKNLKLEKHVQELSKGSYLIYADGKIKSAMTQIAYPSLLLNGVKLFFTKRNGKTVKEYFGNIVGIKNYEKLFTHLFCAVLSQNADNYPADIFLKRRGGRYEEFPRKYTFDKGLASFIDLIAEKSNLEIVKNSEVIKFETEERAGKFKITLSSGISYLTSNIAFATDPATTARLLNNTETRLSTLLETVPLSHSQSMNVIIKKEKINVKTVAGIIPVSDEFNSAVSRDLLDDANFRSFTFHFPPNEKNRKEKTETICNVLGINESDILEISECDHVLPSLHMEHLGMTQQVEKVQQHENIYILGNYFYGLSLEDCINRSYDEAMRFK